MSSKMSSKRQIKRSKEKRSQDKMDKAMSDVKRIGIISCCLVAVLLIIGFFVDTDESYAADFLTNVPEEFSSSIRQVENGSEIMISDTENGHYIPFRSVFEGSSPLFENGISDIYCIDGRLGLPASQRTYRKISSVKDFINIAPEYSVEAEPISATADYPGLIYILENHETLGGTKDENYYYTQLAVWWYVDLANGYSDENNYEYCTTGTENCENNYRISSVVEDNYDDRYDDENGGAYRFLNNLTVLDKATLSKANQTMGLKIKQLAYDAQAHEGDYTGNRGNIDIVIDESNITYTMNNDYIETSLIKPSSSNSTFESYSVQVNNAVGNVEIVDENNNVLDSSSINASTGFKLRVPISELNGETFKANITINAYFKDYYDAYIYETDNINAQRALLGQIEKQSASTTIDLAAPSINVPDTASTSYLVYGIGALIIIAGIILIVVAKRPNNAKKK